MCENFFFFARLSREKKEKSRKNKLSNPICPQSSRDRLSDMAMRKPKKRAGRFIANNLTRLKETRFFTSQKKSRVKLLFNGREVLEHNLPKADKVSIY
jgi:hypothetical protein